MMTHLPKVEPAELQWGEPGQSSRQQHETEKHTVIEVEIAAPAEQALRYASARGDAAGSVPDEMDHDLVRERVNMLELQQRQSRSVTQLSISSKATQAVLRQF